MVLHCNWLKDTENKIYYKISKTNMFLNSYVTITTVTAARNQIKFYGVLLLLVGRNNNISFKV